MNRVLVDLLFFTGKKGGMESYVRELYSAMPELEGIEFIGLASTELAASDNSWFPGEIYDSGISGESRLAWAAGELFAVARFARRLRADLVHSPANLGPACSSVPVVLTVHDLLPFRHPEYVPGGYSRILRAMIRLAARTSRRVLTVSDASRGDIIRFLGIPKSCVDVVPLGARERAVAPQTRLPRQLLAVGNRMPHKNFPLLLEALAIIPVVDRPTLVITGSHGEDPLAPMVARHSLSDWVSLRGWLSSDELDDLYSESTLVVFPTLFEGFGLPVLEAMAHGCPVLCSELPVLREVAADAAAYVDPVDARALAEAIIRLLGAPEERKRMSVRGRERARDFSWPMAAHATVDTFQRVLAEL